ncbi:MAG: hypothetical protein EHM21_14670 [Chloroflexi bacterium]|nr:MAG: hypothetical protein EHM21_14670 [Chloroflexota bacterium]
MEHSNDFQAVFERLKPILQEYAKDLQVKADGSSGYSLDSHFSKKYGKELFFGAVKIEKRYVSYHLMPVYMFPDLLKDISPALKKRMQGKSCFNFKAIDEPVFAELSNLTRLCFERFQQNV